jgi:hypothetical protein
LKKAAELNSIHENEMNQKYQYLINLGSDLIGTLSRTIEVNSNLKVDLALIPASLAPQIRHLCMEGNFTQVNTSDGTRLYFPES